MIEVNQIIKNLIPTEPVTVIKVQALGNMYSIKYTGVTTNKTSTKVITKEQFEYLEVLTSEGEFNFKGNPEKFVMFAEAERILRPSVYIQHISSTRCLPSTVVWLTLFPIRWKLFTSSCYPSLRFVSCWLTIPVQEKRL